MHDLIAIIFISHTNFALRKTHSYCQLPYSFSTLEILPFEVHEFFSLFFQKFIQKKPGSALKERTLVYYKSP